MVSLIEAIMGDAIEFTLNGRQTKIEACSPNTTLLEYLRAQGLTGSKEGCAEGDCGACSVAIIDRDSRGNATYRSINSCLVPVCLMPGREIVSVEGVAEKCGAERRQCRVEELHPVQQKMVQCHGSQCGYCTPGFIMSLFEGYYRGDIRTQDQLDDQLCGNLCRSTGYRSIPAPAISASTELPKPTAQDSVAERLN